MRTTSITFPPDHLEQISRSASIFTVDPFRTTVYYFFPFLSAFFSAQQPLVVDPTQEAMLPNEPTRKILKEITDLTHCAGIQRAVTPYIGLHHQFQSFGGKFSLSNPVLFIPDQYLFRRKHNCFGEGDGQLKNHSWIFSDDEVRFFICRELGQMKENNALLRVAIKVSILASLFILYTSCLNPLVGFALFIGALGLYFISEKIFQARADRIGVEILGKKISNPKEVAIQALEKMRKQNLMRRENSSFAKWYITKSGNNVLDLVHPYLTTRIKALHKL